MTRSRLLTRSFVLALALGAPAIAASCGGDSSSKPGGTGGTGGGGGGGGETPRPEPIECGAETCTPLDNEILSALKQDPIPACCAEGNQCGLDTARLSDYGLSFEDVCQPKHQPGEANPDCPDSAPLMLPGSPIMPG